jgi:hypothetical protein
LSDKPEKITVTLKYEGVEQQFSGEPEEVWLLLKKFFSDIVPSFTIAQKLMLSIDIQQLSKDLHCIVAFSVEGICLLIPKNRLTDNEALLVWLASSYLGKELSLVENDFLSKDELQIRLGKSGKIISTRIGELVKDGMVTRIGDNQFKITTFGLTLLQKEIVPKIKVKTLQFGNL